VNVLYRERRHQNAFVLRLRRCVYRALHATTLLARQTLALAPPPPHPQPTTGLYYGRRHTVSWNGSVRAARYMTFAILFDSDGTMFRNTAADAGDARVNRTNVKRNARGRARCGLRRGSGDEITG